MPKAASTTVSEMLIKRYGGQPCFDRHDNRFFDSTQKFFHFTTIRDPYSRAISAYNHARPKPEEDIETLFKRFHFVSMSSYLKNEFAVTYNVYVEDLQSKFMTGNPGPGMGIHRIRVENLEDEFGQLPFIRHPIKLEVMNESKPVDIDAETMNKIVRYVNDNYKEDFEIFGYQMRVV
jgi:hypothetical protein